MKIISLEATNIKRLSAVEIRPDPNNPVVLIRGMNGAGKSSVLDAISYALGGKDTHPPKVIREGEDHAEVVLDLGDLVVTRRWTANDRSSLVVEGKDGARYPSPQAMLDGLTGRLSFDPLSFMRLKAKEQLEALRNLVGVDFSALDAKRADLYGKRTSVNRDLERAKARLGPAPSTVPTRVDVAALLAEQERLLRVERQNGERITAVATVASRVDAKAEEIAKTKQGIADLEARLAKGRALLERQEAEIVELRRTYETEDEALKAAPNVGPDLERVRERLKNAEELNAAVRAAAEREQLAGDIAKLESETLGYTAQINAVDVAKEQALKAAKFPVEGLSFGADGVLLNGVPLEQASSAEKLRVSVAMGLALNPKLRVLLIRDGSLLDETSLRLVAEMAAAAGGQCWVEMVSKGPVGVLIEDGSVTAVNGKPVPPLAPPAEKKRSRADHH